MPDKVEPVAVPDDSHIGDWTPPGYVPPVDGENDEDVTSVHSHGDSEPVDEESS